MSKSRSKMTADEVRSYFDCYFATIDTLNAALTKFEALAAAAKTPEEKSRYNAEALGVQRELELLTNKRRAFQADQAAVNPPARTLVDQVKQIARDAASARAVAAQFQALTGLVAGALSAFSSVQA